MIKQKEETAIFTTLNNVPISNIHQAFISAFSDYSVKVDMPLEKFRALLKGNSVDLSLSAGVFEDGILCGFILNGIRADDGKYTAYDSGTGVIPQYRKRGLTKGMFSFLLPLLKEKGVKRYLLEVIQTNTAAFSLYKGLGFSIMRELICFKSPKENLKRVNTDIIRTIPIMDLDTTTEEAMRDYSPTWQNAFASIFASPESCAATVAGQSGEIVGYGVINTQSGAVYQLAVKKEMRGRGIGAALLYALSRQTQARDISFINVDTQCASMPGFLDNLGFKEYARQFEMELEI